MLTGARVLSLGVTRPVLDAWMATLTLTFTASDGIPECKGVLAL